MDPFILFYFIYFVVFFERIPDCVFQKAPGPWEQVSLNINEMAVKLNIWKGKTRGA